MPLFCKDKSVTTAMFWLNARHSFQKFSNSGEQYSLGSVQPTHYQLFGTECLSYHDKLRHARKYFFLKNWEGKTLSDI